MTVCQTPQTSQELKMAGARCVAEDVATEGNTVTTEGPSAAQESGRKLAERLAR